MLPKLSVEEAILNNGVFTCTCFLGDEEMMPKEVLFDELVKFMGGRNGMIPVNDEDIESSEYDMPLTQWIENHDHFDLCWELGRTINDREWRTGFHPSRVNQSDLLSSNIQQQIKACAA